MNCEREHTRSGSYTTLNHLPCGCDLRAEWLAANEHVRVQFLATAPNHTSRASSAAESPKLSPRGAAPRRRAISSRRCRYAPLARFTFFVRLPPLAGGDVDTSKPTAKNRRGVNAQPESQIENLAGVLGRMTANNAFA